MKITNVLTGLIPLLLLNQVGNGQTATFSSNFEDQNTAAEIGKEKIEVYEGDNMYVVPNPHHDVWDNSDYVLKIVTDKGSRSRAEYSIQRHETYEKKYIYTWKYFFPTGMFTDIKADAFLINQWKTWPCEAIPDKEPYLKYDTLICEGGGIFNELHYTYPGIIEYRSRAWPNCNSDYFDLPMGYWNKFILEVYWTNTENGYYRIWRNDTLFGYSDNIKTLFDDFLKGTCDIYFSTGLYVGWNQTGAKSQTTLSAYIDDVALYDMDKGFTINDICPNCEVAPSVSTESNVYKINLNTNTYAPDGYNNWITSYRGDTNAIDISNTFGQNNGIDVYLWSGTGTSSSSLSSKCFPGDVINTGINWSDNKIHKIYLKDLNPARAYAFKILAATTSPGTFRGTQIWTNNENRATVLATGNTCNLAELKDLVPDADGNLTINVKSISNKTPRAYINSIEIVEYDNPCSGKKINILSNVIPDTSSKGVGAINISVKGGNGTYNYLWSNGETAQHISGLTKGSYSVTVTEGEGCSGTKSIDVYNYDPCSVVKFTISGNVTPDTLAKKVGAIDIDVKDGSAPYTFAWSTGQTTQDVSGLSEGSYTVTVVEGSGCASKKTFDVSNYDPCSGVNIAITGTVTPDTLAKRVGAIDINVKGGTAPYTYSWNNSKTLRDISGLSKGKYYISVTDKNGCTGTKSFSLTNYDPCTENPILVEGFVSPDTLAKGVGSIDISVSGGTSPYTYTWWRNSETSQDISGLTVGSYPITVTDKIGCFSTKIFEVGNINP